MSINAKSVKFLATVAFAIPMFVFAEHDWQGVSLDESAQAYLTSIGSNWYPANVPDGDSLRFMKGGTTVTLRKATSGLVRPAENSQVATARTCGACGSPVAGAPTTAFRQTASWL